MALFDRHFALINIGLTLIVAEVIAPGAFLFWLGLGAVVAGMALAASPGAQLGLQLLVFALSITASALIGINLQTILSRSNKHADDLNDF